MMNREKRKIERMIWMTKMENIVMNLTGCDRQIANTVVNTILEEDAKANSDDMRKEDEGK